MTGLYHYTRLAAGWSGVATGRPRCHGGAEHHQDDQGQIEQNECPAFIQIPELAGHQQRGRQRDQLGQALASRPECGRDDQGHVRDQDREAGTRCRSRPRSCRWSWVRTRATDRPRRCCGAQGPGPQTQPGNRDAQQTHRRSPPSRRRSGTCTLPARDKTRPERRSRPRQAGIQPAARPISTPVTEGRVCQKTARMISAAEINWPLSTTAIRV